MSLAAMTSGKMTSLPTTSGLLTCETGQDLVQCRTMIPFPDKKYSIIYADPPWEYEFSHTRARAITDYPTLKEEDICRFPVQDIAESNSILLLWVTFPKLEQAFNVMRAWGFRYITNVFTWIKQNKNGEGLFWGMGYYTRSNAELCLLAKRGNGIPAINHNIHSVIQEPVGKHSRKPPIIRERIVQLLGDLPRIELFARKKDMLFDAECFDGWDVWGDSENLV